MREIRKALVASVIIGATAGNVEPRECVGTWAWSVFGWSGGRGRNRRYRRERSRIPALLPLWLLWLLRTTGSPAVSTRVERLRMGKQLLLRA
jgi:hypothetical protein